MLHLQSLRFSRSANGSNLSIFPSAQTHRWIHLWCLQMHGLWPIIPFCLTLMLSDLCRVTFANDWYSQKPVTCFVFAVVSRTWRVYRPLLLSYIQVVLLPNFSRTFFKRNSLSTINYTCIRYHLAQKTFRFQRLHVNLWILILVSPQLVNAVSFRARNIIRDGRDTHTKCTRKSAIECDIIIALKQQLSSTQRMSAAAGNYIS